MESISEKTCHRPEFSRYYFDKDMYLNIIFNVMLILALHMA